MVSVAALISIGANAQTPQTTTAPAPDQTQVNGSTQTSTKNPLNLTPDQQKQMQQIRADEKAKKAAIENDNTLTDAQKQEQLKTLHKQTEHQRKSVLTPEQRSEAKQLKAEKKANRAASPASPAAPAAPSTQPQPGK